MNMQDFWNNLQPYIQQGVLTLPSRAPVLGSDIPRLIDDVFNHTLSIQIMNTPAPVSNALVLEGQLQSPLFGDTSRYPVSATFTIDPNSQPQVILETNLPSSWHMAQSFPALEGSLLGTIDFTTAAFTFVSSPTPPPNLHSGVNFRGNLDLSVNPLRSITWLLGTPTTLTVAGPLTPTGAVPLLDWRAVPPSSQTQVGSVNVMFYLHFVARSAAPGRTLVAAVELAGDLVIDGTPITCAVPLYKGSLGILNLTADVGGLILQDISALEAFSQGESLAAHLPAITPQLSTSVALNEIAIAVDAVQKDVLSVTLQVGLAHAQDQPRLAQAVGTVLPRASQPTHTLMELTIVFEAPEIGAAPFGDEAEAIDDEDLEAERDDGDLESADVSAETPPGSSPAVTIMADFKPVRKANP